MSQDPLCRNPFWLSNACATRKGPESEWLAKDNPDANPTHKTRDCRPRGRAVLLGSLTLLFSAWVPRLSKISCKVSGCMPPWTIHFQVSDTSPLSGSGRGPPSCKTMRWNAEGCWPHDVIMSSLFTAGHKRWSEPKGGTELGCPPEVGCPFPWWKCSVGLLPKLDLILCRLGTQPLVYRGPWDRGTG